MIYVTLLLLLVNLLIINVESVVVQTAQGKLRGENLQAVTGFKYVSFKGIPYAKPPLGNLRFTAPQPPERWSGIRNATQHGSVCVQINIYNGVDISGDEDCLYLNVYTPTVKPKQPLTVMFFIHGGGYQSGSGNADRYGPDYLVSQNVVVVTINHRLGALGFLCLESKEVPGNAGIKDQVAAMRWVQKNIAKFGGDPKKVTIFGQSTGAASVALHNLSPMTKGLFKRSLAMSGSALIEWAQPFESRRIAFRLGQQLGLWTCDDKELVEFLRSLPPQKLLGTNPAVLRSEEPKITLRQLTFVPVVENYFGAERYMTMHPLEALNCGQIHDVDLLIGHTGIEGIVKFIFGKSKVPEIYTNYTEMLVPRTILENIPPIKMLPLADKIQKHYFGNKQVDDNTGKEFIKYLSDISFNYAITKYAQLYSIHRKTYMYKFTKQPNFPRYGNSQNEFGTVGAMHEDDLLYVFNPGNVTINKNTEDYKVIKTICTLYANFAKFGNPTPSKCLGAKWPTYDIYDGHYMNIDKTLTVGKHLDGNAIEFWDSIYAAAESYINQE